VRECVRVLLGQQPVSVDVMMRRNEYHDYASGDDDDGTSFDSGIRSLDDGVGTTAGTANTPTMMRRTRTPRRAAKRGPTTPAAATRTAAEALDIEPTPMSVGYGSSDDGDGVAPPYPNRQQQSRIRDRPPRRTPSESFHHLDGNVLNGLSVASVALFSLVSVFELFHVETFLKAYRLPLRTYKVGSAAFTLINTANNVAGAWIVDHIAAATATTARAGTARGDITGISGCVFALCFLFPFFRWGSSSGGGGGGATVAEQQAGGAVDSTNGESASASHFYWDGIHFVITIAMYDMMRSFVNTVINAVVNDNHHMTDRDRVRYMASGKVANLLASFVVARIGLSLFDTDDLHRFRLFLLALSSVAAISFVVAQALISWKAIPRRFRRRDSKIGSGILGNSRLCHYVSWLRNVPSLLRTILDPRRHHQHRRENNNGSAQDDGSVAGSLDRQSHELAAIHDRDDLRTYKLHWRSVVLDFWRHGNFTAWVGMEMLLEAQLTFVTFFLKLFVDNLLFEAGGVSRQACDWLLSVVRPLTHVSTIFMFVPIRRLGYPRVYAALFTVNAALSLAVLWAASKPNSAFSTYWILLFIIIYPVITGAVQSSCFHLAQADMVLEMKRKHALEGRHKEPSLAGLFLGANALLCKPVESFLPITAATVLQRHANSIAGGAEDDDGGAIDSSSMKHQSLFYLLVLPPLICSCFQLLAIRRFNLTSARTAKMREELKLLRRMDSYSAVPL